MVVGDDDSVYFGGRLGQTALAIWKLTPAGEPDSSFGIDGLATVGFADLGVEEVIVGRLTVQADGSLVIAGHETGAEPSLAIARIAADGDLDPTFGAAGRQVHAFPGFGFSIRELRAASDDSLIAGGSTQPFSIGSGDRAFVKLQPDGDRDDDFDGDGFGLLGAGSIRSFRVAASGTIVGINSGDPSVVVAVNPNGGGDNNFGTAGVAEVTTLNANLAVDSAGSVFVGGTDFVDIAVTGNPTISKLTSTGEIDTTFGVGGDLEFLGSGNVKFLEPEPAGLLVAIQLREGLASTDVIVTRLDATGSVVPSFGVDGELRVPASASASVFETAPHQRLLFGSTSKLVRVWR
jgi:uncharacterized delta-60 repeat protein